MVRLMFALSLLLFGQAQAESLKDTTSSISVVGEAVEEVAPDRATLRFAVVTERPTAAAAAADNARAVQEALAELKALGVADPEVQTQGVTLEAVNVEERDPKGKPRTTQRFYRAQNELTARIKPIDKAGEILGALIDKGVNRVVDVDYDFSDPAEKRDALRAAAMKDAERRARAYAEAAGLRLARVLEIRPEERRGPEPRPYFRAAMAADAAPPVPLRPGLQRLSERVSVTWALSR
jgi:uncharacterized protein YggE